MQVDRIGYYKLLLNYREDGVTFYTFFCKRNYLVSRFCMLALSVALLLEPSGSYFGIGLLTLGLFLGSMASGTGIFLRMKKTWKYEAEALDWKMIEAACKEVNTTTEAHSK